MSWPLWLCLGLVVGIGAIAFAIAVAVERFDRPMYAHRDSEQ